MPEIDKNYLAGLYLDEITLDVMPQEYIDAALEVKLRYDACAPRAGYNCVQDRRVKGGFYYRKAPQGQGVNALPPSKLERALARSQEQPTQRSGLSFLNKAAIGAGVAIGGLALTCAVVNAGRSSEPYQEPVRQRPEKAKTSYNAATIGVAGVAATSVGAAVVGLGKKPEPQKGGETITPQESAKVETPKPVKTPEEEEGYKEQQRRNQAISELTTVGYDTQRKAYEQALSKDLEKAGVTPEGIEQKKKNLQFADDNEGFVRIDQVKENTADGVQLTKAARAKQSEDLQVLYDKFKENGVEDAIEFRTARSRSRVNAGSELTAPSSNPYTIVIDGEAKSVGEMRFRKNRDQIVSAIAENIKNPQARSQPPEKSAKPPEIKVEPKPPAAEKPATTEEGDRPKRNLVDDLSVKLSRSISEDGFVAQSGLISELKKKSQYKNADLDQEIEDLANNSDGRIQLVTDKYGKTLVRDLDQVKVSKLVAEAKKLTDPESDRKRLLDDALSYKTRKATNDNERAGVAELQAAIAGIQEVKPEPRVSNKKPPAPKPDNEGGEDGGKKVRGESAKMKAAAAKAKNQGTPNVEPSIVVRSEQEIEADRLAAEQAKKAKKQQAAQSKREGLTGVSGRAEALLTDKVLDLEMRRQKNEIEDREFNAEVEKLRKEAVVVRAVTEAIRPTQEEYQELVNKAKTAAEQKSLQEKGTKIMEQQARDVYDRFNIPELIEIASKAKETTPPPVTPAPKATSEANAAAVSKLSKKEVPPINEEEAGNPTLVAPKVEDIAKIEGVYNSRIKDAESIGDKMLKANAIRNAFRDKERAIAALSNPPESSSVPASTPENKLATEKKKKSSASKPKEETPPAPTNSSTESERAVKGLQDSIAKTEATVQKLQDNIAKMKSGGNPSRAVIDLLNLSSKTLADLSPEGLISKMENAVTYHNGQVKEKQKELKVLSKKPKDELAGTTVATIKEMLKSQGIAIPKGMTTKAELLELLPKTDAIAPPEIYLSAYEETRNKYRRVN
jgi:hypothetical protein